MANKESNDGHLVGISLQYSAFAHIERQCCARTPDQCGFSDLQTGILGPLVYCRIPVTADEEGKVSVIDGRDGQETSMKNKDIYCPDEKRIGLKIIDPNLNPRFE